MLFLQNLLEESGRWCSTSTSRDLETISARVKTEGFSFLAITLPDFCKDFERSLANEQVDPSLFRSFAKKGQLPRFLGGLLDQVFDRDSGHILDDPSITAIRCIRQITLAFSKTERKCSNERIQAAYSEYVRCELDVRRGDRARSLDDLLDYRRVAHLLWRSLNSRLDRRINDGELIPRHGPGSTADKLVGNKKFTLKEWTTRMEDANLRYVDYASASYIDYINMIDDGRVDFHEPGNERPVKVTDVPKTLKTPRIIAMEPTCMMFMQQALLAEFADEFDSDKNAINFVRFASQEPNQLLAQEGSLTGELATLDMKEASDRVSNQLVRELFHYHPHLGAAVEAVRSRKADVPGHGVIRLAKYASMGSGLTFPLEAMVFTTLIFLGIESDLMRPLTQNDLTKYFGKVRVYGDDIIVPVEHVDSAIRVLEHFGAKVNSRKSFWTGKFRESCGEEFYAGRPVTVARARKDFPRSLKDGSRIVGMVSLRNQLHELGYEQTVSWLDSQIVKILGAKRYPKVTPNSPILGKWTHSRAYDVHKSHGHFQTPMVKGYVEVPRIPANSVDGYGALLKVLSKRSQTPIPDIKHLTHSGRAISVDIKLKWASPV